VAASEVLVGPVYQTDREENPHLLEFSLHPPTKSTAKLFCSVSTLKKKKTQRESTRKSEQKGISA